MHTSTRMIPSARALAFLGSFGALLLSCNSTDTFAPPAATCDERNSGSFTIDNPEVGHVYVWGGTGHPGAGDLGQLPGATNLYWPIDVSFEPATGKPIVLDHNNHRVLGIDANGNFEKLIGQYFGEPNPIEDPLPKLGINTALNHPTHVSFAPDGRMIVSAWHNSVVLEMDMSTRMVNLVCGTGGRCFNGDPHEPLTSCSRSSGLRAVPPHHGGTLYQRPGQSTDPQDRLHRHLARRGRNTADPQRRRRIELLLGLQRRRRARGRGPDELRARPDHES